jgi:hypothetical protein
MDIDNLKRQYREKAKSLGLTSEYTNVRARHLILANWNTISQYNTTADVPVNMLTYDALNNEAKRLNIRYVSMVLSGIREQVAEARLAQQQKKLRSVVFEVTRKYSTIIQDEQGKNIRVRRVAEHKDGEKIAEISGLIFKDGNKLDNIANYDYAAGNGLDMNSSKQKNTLYGTEQEIQAKIDRIKGLVETFDYVHQVKVIENIEVPINRVRQEINQRLIRDSYTLFQKVDVGDGFYSETVKTDSNFCGPDMLAELLDGYKDTMDPDKKNTRHTPPITFDRIIEYIRKHRESDVDISMGVSIDEILQVAKACNMKYLYIYNNTFKSLLSYKHPDYGHVSNKDRYLKPGLIAVVNSGHFTKINRIMTVGQSIEYLRPMRMYGRDWPRNCKTVVIEEWDDKTIDEMINVTEKTIYYVIKWNYASNEGLTDHIDATTGIPFKRFSLVNPDLFKQVCSRGVRPQIMRVDNKTMDVNWFSVGNASVMYTPDYNVVYNWCQQLKVTHPKLKVAYTGQSARKLAYTFFERSVRPSYLSPMTFDIMNGNNTYFSMENKHQFAFVHNGSLPNWNKENIKHYVPIDMTKWYAFCMANMPFGEFTLRDDPMPFNGVLVDTGFYPVTKIRGHIGHHNWPSHGAGKFYSGLELREYIVDGLTTLADIDIQIIPSRVKKAGSMNNVIRSIFDNLGKGGPNELNGVLKNAASSTKMDTFTTTDIEEVMDLIDEYGFDKINLNIMNIKAGEHDIPVYNTSIEGTARPVYVNYLPIHLMVYSYSRYKQYSMIKDLVGNKFDAVVGIFTDCVVIDSSKVTLPNIPLKKDVSKTEFGIPCIEDHMPAKKDSKNYAANEKQDFALPAITFNEIDGTEYVLNAVTPSANVLAIYERIAKGMSCVLDEEGGKAKSAFLKGLIKYLRTVMDEDNILITSSTGVTAQKLDEKAITTHSALGIRGYGKDDSEEEENTTTANETSGQGYDKWNKYTKVIIIDEAFFLEQKVLNMLMKKKLYNKHTAIVFVGSTIQLNCDVMLFPVANNTNSFIHKLVNGNRISLKINYRFIADKDGLSIFIQELIENIRSRSGLLPVLSMYNINHEHHPLAICATINQTVILNRYWSNRISSEQNKIQYRHPSMPWPIFTGMPIIEITKVKTGGQTINNGQQYIIQEILKDGVILSFCDENRVLQDRESVKVSFTVLAKSFLVAYAITGHRSQGANIKIPYSIYGWFDAQNIARTKYEWMTWHYVVCSRTNLMKNINICDFDEIAAYDKLNCIKDASIYMIKHRPTDRIYIGSTMDFEKRKADHMKADQTCLLHECIRNFGWQEFDMEEIEKLPTTNENELRLYEQCMIELYKPYFNEKAV